MRRIASVLIGFVLSSATLAQEVPMVLAPLPGEQTPTIRITMNVYGKCGNSAIGVFGVDYNSYQQGFLKFDAASGKSDVMVRMNKKDGTKTDISFKDKLSDSNLLYCIKTANGDRLLLGGSTCKGDICSDALNYAVIDPNAGVDLTGKQKSCDKACANQLLGAKFLQ